MNKTIIAFTIVTTSLVMPHAALAWDGARSWFDTAEGQSPGGGGIVGTGSARDYRITCEACHVQRAEAGQIDATFTFTPPLQTAGVERLYEPGRLYTVDARIVGEFLTGPCDQYMAHTNNFAANFENAVGESMGVLESDSGQTQTSCPPDYPDPQTGTTVMYKDCRVILSNGAEDRTQWRFYWRAPAAGSGAVIMYYGAVDGNCGMDSMGDSVIVDKRTLFEGTAKAAPSPMRRRWRYALGSLFLLPFAGVLWVAWRRRKRAYN